MIDDLSRLIGLLEELDDEHFEFDTKRSESTGSVRSSGNHRSGHRRSGREKFKLKRKIKKINRLLKKLERNEDTNIENLLESEPPNVRFVEAETGGRIVVDAAGAELGLNGDEVVITVGGHEIRRTFDSEPELIERTEKLTTTVFEITT